MYYVFPQKEEKNYTRVQISITISKGENESMQTHLPNRSSTVIIIVTIVVVSVVVVVVYISASISTSCAGCVDYDLISY